MPTLYSILLKVLLLLLIEIIEVEVDSGKNNACLIARVSYCPVCGVIMNWVTPEVFLWPPVWAVSEDYTGGNPRREP